MARNLRMTEEAYAARKQCSAHAIIEERTPYVVPEPDSRAGTMILLPFPPSANRYWRHAKGRTYISKQALAYRAAVADAVGRTTPLKGELAVKLSFDYPDKRKRDLDNLCKQCLDAMQHAGVYEDDSQIVQLLLVRNSIVTRSDAECMVLIEVLK